MPPGLKRSLVTAVAATTLGVVGLAAPVQASPAGGGNYAGSVATNTVASVSITQGNVSGVARIFSTSEASKWQHGTVRITITRTATGKKFLDVTRTVNGSSARSYWGSVRLPKKKRWYRVTAVYTAEAGHVEKSSSGYHSFKY